MLQSASIRCPKYVKKSVVKVASKETTESGDDDTNVFCGTHVRHVMRKVVRSILKSQSSKLAVLGTYVMSIPKMGQIRKDQVLLPLQHLVVEVQVLRVLGQVAGDVVLDSVHKSVGT